MEITSSYITKHGFRMLKFNDKTQMVEHRYIMEQELGRPLEKGEHVRRYNEDKTDNRVENLHLATRQGYVRKPKVEKPLAILCIKEDNYGYMRIYYNDQTWIQEHRYVMEQHLGRKLSSKEFVHHINQDRKDNRIENLEIMSQSTHQVIHNKGTKRSEETKQKISIAQKERWQRWHKKKEQQLFSN